MKKDVLIELEPELATEFVSKLEEKNINVEGPHEIDALDGVTLASIIITITPVVAPYIIEFIQTLKGGSKGKIRTGDMTLDLENYSGRQLKEILGIIEEKE